VEFDRDDDDVPILDDPSQMMAQVMEPMVRQFLAIHYSKPVQLNVANTHILYSHHIDIFSCGKKTAVDWTALSENQDDMIDPMYLPADFIFRDPSKMKKCHYQALLEHWYQRQQSAKVDKVFKFKGYWDASQELVVAVLEGHSASRWDQRKSTQVKRGGVTKTDNKSKKRPGPPGIRAGELGFDSNLALPSSSEDENGEDEREGARPRRMPLDLPFSAKRVNYRHGTGNARIGLRKNTQRFPGPKHLPAVSARLRVPEPSDPHEPNDAYGDSHSEKVKHSDAHALDMKRTNKSKGTNGTRADDHVSMIGPPATL
jgi:hypothetical protein